MESPTHSLPSLFKQLGLPDDAESIDKFIATHSPLKPELHLADAFFWSESQAQFLRDDILDDADWAEVVDQLDVLLRKGRGCENHLSGGHCRDVWTSASIQIASDPG